MARGDYRQIGNANDWAGATAFVGLAGNLYAVASGQLYRIHTHDGSYEKLGGGGWKTRALLANLGTLVALEESGTVYTMSPGDGSYEKVSGDGEWASTRSASSCRDWVITNDNGGALYWYKARHRQYDKLPVQGSWKSRLIGATSDGLFTRDNAILTVEESGSMYGMDLASGEYRQVSGDWSGAKSLVGLGRFVYCGDGGGKFYVVDPRAGTYEELGGSSGGSRASRPPRAVASTRSKRAGPSTSSRSEGVVNHVASQC